MVDYNAIVSIVQKISDVHKNPCKKTIQKMVFLIQARGVDLGCDYGIHFYGPYSADLDFAIRELSSAGVLDINYTSMEHIISVDDDSDISYLENETIDEVINEFGTASPNELELLATTLYVYLKTGKDVRSAKDGVIKIKGAKFSECRVDSAIERLKKAGYMS